MSLDWSILHWIQNMLVCPALNFLMPKITLLGNGGMIWLLASGVLICTKKYRRQGILLLCGLAAGVLVGNVFLKNFVARPRPCWREAAMSTMGCVAPPDSIAARATAAGTISIRRGSNGLGMMYSGPKRSSCPL